MKLYVILCDVYNEGKRGKFIGNYCQFCGVESTWNNAIKEIKRQARLECLVPNYSIVDESEYADETTYSGWEIVEVTYGFGLRHNKWHNDYYIKICEINEEES